MKPLPYTAKELVEELEQEYPEPVIRANTPVEELKFNAGARALVLKLRARLNQRGSNVQR